MESNIESFLTPPNPKVNYGIWGKMFYVLILAVLIVLGVAVVAWYRPIIEQNQRIRQDIIALQREIVKEEALGKQLTASYLALKNDPLAVERIARERLGYAKPGEIVVRFESLQSNAPPIIMRSAK